MLLVPGQGLVQTTQNAIWGFWQPCLGGSGRKAARPSAHPVTGDCVYFQSGGTYAKVKIFPPVLPPKNKQQKKPMNGQHIFQNCPIVRIRQTTGIFVGA